MSNIRQEEAERFYMRFRQHGEFALATYGLDIPKPIEQLLLKGRNEDALNIYLQSGKYDDDPESVMTAMRRSRHLKSILKLTEGPTYRAQGTRIVTYYPVFRKHTVNAIAMTAHLPEERIDKAVQVIKGLHVPHAHRPDLLGMLTAMPDMQKALELYRTARPSEKAHVYDIRRLPEKFKKALRKQRIPTAKWYKIAEIITHKGLTPHLQFTLHNLKDIIELPDFYPQDLGKLRELGIARVKGFIDQFSEENKKAAFDFILGCHTKFPDVWHDTRLAVAVKQYGLKLKSYEALVDIQKEIVSPSGYDFEELMRLRKKYGQYISAIVLEAKATKERDLEKVARMRDCGRGGEYPQQIIRANANHVEFPVEIRSWKNPEDFYSREEVHTLAHAVDGRAIGWIRTQQSQGRLFIDNIQHSDHKLPTKLRKETDNWDEEAIAFAEEKAREKGLKTIVMNTPHEMIQRSRGLGINQDTLKRFYYDLPKKMGYELQYFPDKKGFYWTKELN